MADSFGRWLEAVLGESGLVVYDASGPATKPHVCNVFARELEGPGETVRLAAEAGEALRSRGYHAQVTPHEHAVALFSLDGGRLPIRVSGDRFLVRDERVPRRALLAQALDRPESFSPNPSLRPGTESDQLWAGRAFSRGAAACAAVL